MDEMDDYYRNKISLCPKYIEWTTLPDKSEMFYCKKYYRKPVDEIKLLAHIKTTIVMNDRATQKRKKQKSCLIKQSSAPSLHNCPHAICHKNMLCWQSTPIESTNLFIG